MTLVIGLLLVAGLVVALHASAGADVLLCPLFQDVAVPIRRHQCETPVRRLCNRVCKRFPGVAFCQTCRAVGGGCLPPNPTALECCRAGYEVFTFDDVAGMPVPSCSAICAAACTP
jgi:hypothetical protein